MRVCLIIFLAVFLAESAFAEKATLILEHDDASAWNMLLKEGLQKAGRDFGWQTEVMIAAPDTDQTASFRKAAENSDLVIVATDNFHEILRDNAANYRRVKFGAIDAGIRAANIMSVTFRDEQAAFLAGAVAAMLTDQTEVPGINADRTIAWLSGTDTPAMRSLFNGYSEGAALARQDTRVIQALCDSFTDSAAASAKTEKLLEAGADIVAMAAGAANNGALAAAASKNVWTIGLDRPDNTPHELGAIVKAADKAVYEIVKSAQSGHFRAKEIVEYDLKNGGVDFVLGNRLEKTDAGRNLARRTAELRRELRAGSIRLKSLRQRTLCDCLD